MRDGQSVGRTDGRSVSRSVGQSAGITLVELLVVLVLLGLLTTLGAVSVMSLRPPPQAARLDSLRAARAESIRTGVPVMRTFDSVPIRFLPDGRALGGPLDPLTGAWHNEP